ncbi:DUF2490 domain-containing protein [Parafilimonas sp.]|uniref:DUF2490 domain-containing protein n=1 Tax=Parafilimonas sp. TaxID=1969739 RepID=UPI0039E3E1C8
MRKQKIILTIVISFFLFKAPAAQTISENTGWLAWFNTYKFSKRFGLTSDVQVRSADNRDYVRHVLIRPGLTFYINSKSNATAGYAFIGHYNRLPDPAKNTLVENRIWEQYIYNMKLSQVSLQHRFRLEQRFIERQADQIFSQRLRYFARLIVPIAKQEAAFAKGFFAAVQNEIFFNIQNKEMLNGKLFDQNRVYGAVGYRFNAKFDMDAGYLNQYIKGASANTSNNAIQLAFYTRF